MSEPKAFNPLILDNVAIPTGSMSEASVYYWDYTRHNGTKTYQEYIQLVAKHVDGGPDGTSLKTFMDEHLAYFCIMADWSNQFWKKKAAGQLVFPPFSREGKGF